ncbi:hypothetical protein M1D34_28780 (plasmid) [Ensifer sp. D2-11]
MSSEILETGNVPALKYFTGRTLMLSGQRLILMAWLLAWRRYETIANAERNDLFVLSTFIAPADDENGRENRERITTAIERACRRGVHVHLFYRTTLDERSGCNRYEVACVPRNCVT